MAKNKKSWFKKFLWFLKWAAILFFGSTLFAIILFKWVPIPFTSLMFIRSYEMYVDDKDVVWEKDWVPIEEISPHLVQAVVASEDQLFMEHWGFDFKSMEKAYESNKKGKKIRGASTISQQTAKNVFLWPARSYIRKAFEMYFTTLIELIWGKERIMEVYLNVIEMGNGIYGCEAAAQHYFKKSAKKLTRSEAALIAAVLPSPLKRNPARPSNYVSTRKNQILKQMGNFPQIDFNKPAEEEKPKKKKSKKKKSED